MPPSTPPGSQTAERELTRRGEAAERARDGVRHAPPKGQQDMPARLRAVIGRLSRRLRHTVAGSGLTPSQISVLVTVVRRGPLRMAELAELEAINPTMLSRITGQLTSSGLIVRTEDPRDRRAAVVEATAAGRRMRGQIHRERTAALQAQLADLDAADRDALAAALPALERLAERIGERS